MDRRQEILKQEYEKVFSSQKYDNSVNKEMNKMYVFPAMDTHAEQMCLELLGYMARNGVVCFHDEEGFPLFKCKGNELTAEELFNNFL